MATFYTKPNTSLDDSYFKTVTDSMHSAIVCFNMDRTIAYYNPSFEKIFNPKTFIADFAQKYVVQEYKSEIEDRWEKAFENYTFDHYEFKIITDDNSEKWMDFHCHPVYDEQKRQVAVYMRLIDIDMHKRIGLAYAESREKVMSGFLKAPFPTAIVASDGEIIQLNKSWELYTGYTLNQLTDKNILTSLFKLKSQDELKYYADSWLSKTTEEKGDIRICKRSGEERIWEFSLTSLGALKEDKTLSLIMVIDVTEQRYAMEAIKESESRFRSMADSAPVMIWQTDKSAGITFVNKILIDFIGKPYNEILGFEWLNYIHPEDKGKVLQMFTFNHALKIEALEFRILRFDSQYRWIYSKGSPRFKDNGEFIGFIGSSIDITERIESEEKIRESEASLQAIFNSSVQSFILLDKNYKVRAFNNKANIYAKALFDKNITKKSLIFDYIYPKDKELLIEQFQKAVNGEFVSAEYLMVLPENQSVWLEMSYIPVYEDSQIVGVCLSTLDITGRKKAEKAIKENKHFVEKIADTSPNIIYLIDLDLDRYIYVNKAWENVMGYNLDALKTVSANEFFNSKIKANYLEEKPKPFDFNKEWQTIEEEYEILDSQNDWRWIHSSEIVFLRNSNGDIKQVLGTAQDITSRKELENRLIIEAFYDNLTGLPNRRKLLVELDNCLKLHRSNLDYNFAVLFLDLDRFKIINDSLGHNIGDQLLIAITKRISLIVSENNIVSRLGGDEFIVLLKDVKNIKAAIKIAEKIQRSISVPFILDRLNIKTTVSIGIALSDPIYSDAEEIVRDADTAMYSAKSNGRNNYTVFNQKMHTQALKILETEAELSKAIKQNELEVYYQPVLDLKSNKIISCEALIRWNHPKRGLLSPGEFLNIADETGLIINIDKWVLDTACKQLSIWKNEGLGDIKIAINISLKQLRQQRLLYWIKKSCLKYNVSSSQLEFELTENSLIDNSHQTISTLQALKELGIVLSIDDFGTGYTSLMYLKNLPVDVIKIDQSFIRDVPELKQTSAIIKAIVELSHNLNLKVVAEGVQTLEQLQFLKEIKCDMIQGYYLSKAIKAEQVIKVIRQSSQLDK